MRKFSLLATSRTRKKIMVTISLKNVITDITCFRSTNGTSIDVLLTNKSRCFHHTSTFETGLSDCDKLILTFFKAYFKKLPPKNIEY